MDELLHNVLDLVNTMLVATPNTSHRNPGRIVHTFCRAHTSAVEAVAETLLQQIHAGLRELGVDGVEPMTVKIEDHYSNPENLRLIVCEWRGEGTQGRRDEGTEGSN